MKSGYGPAALLGAVILAGGAVGAVLIHNNAKAGADLLADNYYLLCLTVATLGVLIVLTAGIGFCAYLLGRPSKPGAVPPETAPPPAVGVAPAPVTATTPATPATPAAETTEGAPPGFIGVKGDSLDA